MRAARILAELERRGARVEVLEGDRLAVAPRGVLDDELRAWIRARKAEVVAALAAPEVEVAPTSPFDQLQSDWTEALRRAWAGFSHNGVHAERATLEAAGTLEMKAVEWRRMGAAGFPEAQQGLELLGGIYAGRLTARVDSLGRVTISALQERAGG